MEVSKSSEEPGTSEDGRRVTSLKMLTSLAKRPEVDIEFKKLTYVARSGFNLNKKTTILDGISGGFRTGEIAAILGPSGAGKSSLMNILADYNSEGVTGYIDVNGRPRRKHLYHKLSCYIMQEDLVRSGLTVNEAINVSANLKLGSELKSHEKLLAIDEILETLGIIGCKNTRIEKLSGGQRKRFTIALELVNNPPIIFLDEPTSGLDTYSVKQMINLLRCLAHSGRTIVCTIHQPSASEFMLFDKVYFLAKGKCVYQGSPSLLVPFMKESQFHCPVTHNPADYFIELLQNCEENVEIFSNRIKNGSISEIRNSNKCGVEIEDALPNDVKTDMNFPTSFFEQFLILINRMFLQKRRNLITVWLFLLHHILSGLIVGVIFNNIGNDGTVPVANLKFCMGIIVFFMYTHSMTQILLFPFEFQILRREHFNRWYGLNAYFLANTLSNLPLLIFNGMIFIILSYFMTGQILELDRFIIFSLISLLSAVCSEGFGLAIGSILTSQNGSVMGPVVLSPLMAVSVYGLGFGPSIETIMKYIMRISYIRYGLNGLCLAIYSRRGPLECEGEIYCHYGDPKILLRDMGMLDSTISFEIIGLICFTVLHRVIAYLALHFRLEEEFSDRIRKYMIILLRYK